MKFKKLMLTALITSLFLLPIGSTALSGPQEAPVQAASQEYLSGGVPAGMGPADSMSPALHGIVLAMMNHDVSSFDRGNTALAWECLYNTLSLYGQLDSRSDIQDDLLLFPAETAQDYAAALDVVLEDLPPLPEELADRLTWDGEIYRAVCGCDSLSQLQVRDVQSSPDGLQLTGALVYVAEDLDLVRFQATLQPRDNMFGYAVTALSLN